MNDHELHSIGIHVEEQQQPQDALVIDHTHLNHTNMYTCLVNNSFTVDEQSVWLKVRGRIPLTYCYLRYVQCWLDRVSSYYIVF